MNYKVLWLLFIGWAMVNTDVHWVGDYPLALALGYISGKITCLRHKKSTHPLTVL